MIDFEKLPREVPDQMRPMAKLMYNRSPLQASSIFEKVLDREDKYYFSSSEAHALDRRIAK